MVQPLCSKSDKIFERPFEHQVCDKKVSSEDTGLKTRQTIHIEIFFNPASVLGFKHMEKYVNYECDFSHRVNGV